jgi:hypothetical protein
MAFANSKIAATYLPSPMSQPRHSRPVKLTLERMWIQIAIRFITSYTQGPCGARACRDSTAVVKLPRAKELTCQELTPFYSRAIADCQPSRTQPTPISHLPVNLFTPR